MSNISSASSAGDIRGNYLQLLIKQLQNQNPLDPMDNSQMATQLAQLSELEQMENMSSTFSQVLSSTKMNYATSLLGKEVAYVPKDQEDPVVGLVTGVRNFGGRTSVIVGGQDVDPDIIQIIRDAAPQPTQE